MRPDAEAQSPERKVSSTTAMTFCIKIAGTELTTALTNIQARVTGISTG